VGQTADLGRGGGKKRGTFSRLVQKTHLESIPIKSDKYWDWGKKLNQKGMKVKIASQNVAIKEATKTEKIKLREAKTSVIISAKRKEWKGGTRVKV